MSDIMVTEQATEHVEEVEHVDEVDAPSSEILPSRYIPWIPVLAFVQIVCIFGIFFSVFTLSG